MSELLTDYYLELSSRPVRFEAVNQLTNVFFDDSNYDVFAVRSGGVMGVVVKNAHNEEKSLNFRMEDHGPVLSIKFSLDHKVLAVQRTNNSVEFMNFNDTSIDCEYSQSCKKNSNILGFVWLHINEVAIMTDHGVELYLVIPEKKSLKHLKTLSANIQWFIWCSLNKIALLASAHGSQLQPVSFKQGSVVKLPKVETEPGRMALERDVTLATLYDVPAILILRHQSGPQTAEVHVHTLNGPGQSPIKTHILKLALSGRFAINVVDDLILVHHQASRSSQIFDIALPGESDGNVKYHTPIAPARSFRPTSLPLPGIVEDQTHICELYSPNWVVFQPNIIIDAKLGCLWHIKLCLPELCNQISDLNVCTQVALKRRDGKDVLLKVLLDNINQPKPPLDKLQESLNHINSVYRDWLEIELQNLSAAPVNASFSPKSITPPRVVIDQNDIYNEIFQKLDSNKDLRKTECLIISYMTSLSEYSIPPQHIINELLIINLARQKKFTMLQQYLQYGIISNTKALACLLLSLGNMHPSALQMALDMLARIGAKDEIQEILLSENKIISALKIAEDGANPRKFLSAASKSEDSTLLHSILVHFRNNAHFANTLKKDERLMNFVQEYNSIFNI
ncbi:hypothetical protein NQ315_004589 [Exocentrus adspersus]|uniref:Mic1 domain-containing protein n=1 Tax=Exocentrus adspersus TaxID=1586481 RepID=A0AAV8VNP0_9CUCU|nr:hypothetical protein NQ315_004589 [Exocentrus adspersus]